MTATNINQIQCDGYLCDATIFGSNEGETVKEIRERLKKELGFWAYDVINNKDYCVKCANKMGEK